MIRLDLFAFQLSSRPYICTYEIGKQSDAKFLSLTPKYEKKKYFFHIWGVLGALLRTQVNENFRAVGPHNRANKFITREKNNHQFFIYGSQCEKNIAFWAIRGGGGGWVVHR